MAKIKKMVTSVERKSELTSSSIAEQKEELRKHRELLKQQARIEKQMPCGFCGKVFERVRQKQKCCSSLCRYRLRNKINKEKLEGATSNDPPTL